MRILFWNVGRVPLSAMIAEAAHQERADIVILAESEEPVAQLSIALNSGRKQQYLVPRGLPADLRRELRFFSALPMHAVEPMIDDRGIAVRRIRPPIGLDFTIIALHLRSKLHQDSEDQAIGATRLRRVIEEAEARVDHRRTVIVGDLNMNPFERGVVAADGLHAVMTRSVAIKGRRTVDGEERHYFYNPMWNHFGDRPPSPPGTYFRGPSGQTAFFWHMFDQVLLRPDLLPYFEDESLRILTRIGSTALLNADGVPDKGNVSDHLPLVFDLLLEEGLQQ